MRAGVPHFRHPLLDVLENVHDGNCNIRFIRGVATVETVNELAVRRVGEVEDAMFIGRAYKAYRNRKVRK